MPFYYADLSFNQYEDDWRDTGLTTLAEAEALVVRRALDRGDDRDTIEILEVQAVHVVDLDRHREARRTKQRAERAARAEDDERAEYERLRQKYGDGGGGE